MNGHASFIVPALVALLATPAPTPASQTRAKPVIVRPERVAPDGRFRWLPSWRADHAPDWGLALGGGGTWGLAHVGLLEGIHEDGLEPRFLAGTSAGALVGASVAAGITTGELKRFFRASERDPRRSVGGAALEILGTEADPLSSRASMGRAGRGIDGRRPPWRGVVATGRIATELARYLGGAGAVAGSDLDALAVPFRAVATDIDAAETYAPRHGSLIDLVQASIGIPIFAPVNVDGRRLVDGGVFEEVPVPTVRAMGAELVVGVRLTRNGDLHESPPPRLALRRMFRLYDSLTNERQRHDVWQEADVPIAIAVGDASSTSLRGQVDRLLFAGRQSWDRQREQVLKALDAASADGRRFEIDRVVTAGDRDDAAASGVARHLGVDRQSVTVSALRLQLELVRLLRSGRYDDAWFTVEGNTARLGLTAAPAVREIEIEAPVVLAGYFDRVHVGAFDWPTPARVLDRIEYGLSRAREDGHFLSRIAELDLEADGGRLSVRIEEGTIDTVELISELDGSILDAPRTLRSLSGQPARIVSIRERLALLEEREILLRPRLRDVRLTGPGRYLLVIGAEPPPDWEVNWNGGVADGLGIAGWLRVAAPAALGSWSIDARLVGGREGYMAGFETAPRTVGIEPFVRLVGGQPALPRYDARGNLFGERRFELASLSGGIRADLGGFSRGEAAVVGRWVSAEALLPSKEPADETDVGVEVSWSGRVGDDPVHPLTALAWTVGGGIPVAGEDRGWFAVADVEFHAPLDEARLWSVSLLGRISEAGDDDPLPLDRWAEAGSWWEAPRMSPGQTRAREVRRGTAVVRRNLGMLSGFPLRGGLSAAVWRLDDERADLALADKGYGASLFVEAGGMGPLSLMLGVAHADVEGDSLFLLLGASRVPWPGPLMRLPGR